jgi:hypothetical protein
MGARVDRITTDKTIDRFPPLPKEISLTARPHLVLAHADEVIE